MKKTTTYTISALLVVAAIFAVPIVGHFYIVSQYEGLPTLEQLRAQYPTCEQREAFVSSQVKERMEQPIASIADSMPKMQFSDKPVTSLEEWWQIYREGAEKRLEQADEREFGNTLYDLGRGCWHD